MRTIAVLALSTALTAVSADNPPDTMPRIKSTTDLALAPDGERMGVLMAGSPVRVLEQREGWTRVAVEGWVLSGQIPEPERATGEPSMPSPPAPTATGGQNTALGGAIFIVDAGNTIVGSGIAVRLLSEPEETLVRIGAIRQACDAKGQSLALEARALMDKAERALKTIESTSEAFETYDDAKRLRARKLRELEALNKDCLGQVDNELERSASASVLTNGDGQYRFEGVVPGAYMVFAALQSQGARHEWSIKVDLAEAAEQKLDLTTANRTRLEAPPPAR